MCCTCRPWLLSNVARWPHSERSTHTSVSWTKYPAEQAIGHELLDPLAVQHVRLAPGDFSDVARIDQQHRETARFHQFEQGDPVHAGGFHGDGVDFAGCEPLSNALRATVKLGNSRIGLSSRSGGTATKWAALPISIPAALGWVIVRAARDLAVLRLMVARRRDMVTPFIEVETRHRIGYVVLLTLSNGMSARQR